MRRHQFDPVHQVCVECGTAASAAEDGETACPPRRRKHFILVEKGGTREVFCQRGANPNG